MIRNFRHLSPALAALAMMTAVAYAADAKNPSTAGNTDQQFNAIDADQDGVLTLPEIEVYGGKALAKRLQKCDTNKDTKISREELIACKISAHADVGIAP